jgi:pimeloyl-ACP methyl ester carboxylesterase
VRRRRVEAEVITGDQIKAARELLGWTRFNLGQRANLHVAIIERAESAPGDPPITVYKEWPFDVTAIHRPVHLWQGSADTFVPEVVNKPLGDKMPEAVWHEVTDGGHFIAISHADEIMAIAAQDLAGTARAGANR